jgi:uncharacterized protein
MEIWKVPTFMAGMTVATWVIATNGTSFDAERLKGASEKGIGNLDALNEGYALRVTKGMISLV